MDFLCYLHWDWISKQRFTEDRIVYDTKPVCIVLVQQVQDYDKVVGVDVLHWPCLTSSSYICICMDIIHDAFAKRSQSVDLPSDYQHTNTEANDTLWLDLLKGCLY